MSRNVVVFAAVSLLLAAQPARPQVDRSYSNIDAQSLIRLPLGTHTQGTTIGSAR